MIYIYGVVSLRSGRIEWVGQSTNPIARFYGMRSPSGKFQGTRIALILLGTAPDRGRANQTEKKYFERYRKQGGCRKMFRRFRPFPEWRIQQEAKP